MDTLSLEVSFAESLEVPFLDQPHPPRSILILTLAINGQVAVADFAIDISALYNSAQGSGEFFIWTCDCGIPECAGIHYGIQVTHTAQTVVWQAPRRPFEVATRFEFERPAYVAAIEAGVTEYLRYIQGYRAAGIAFDVAAHDWQLEELRATRGRK